jgi:hypothetical protein
MRRFCQSIVCNALAGYQEQDLEQLALIMT